MREDRAKLADAIIRTGAFQYSQERPFRLASGKTSPVYFDMSMLGGDPEALHLVGSLLYDMIRQTGARAVGGPETGAIPVSTAVALASYQKKPLKSFYIRKDQSDHGTRRAIEGPADSPAIILDDVITTGGSALRALQKAQDSGIECLGIYCILFRGSASDEKNIRKKTKSFRYILHRDDFKIKKSIEPSR